MGLNDAQEMLDAARAQSVLDEREIDRLRHERDALSLTASARARQRDRLQHAINEIRHMCDESDESTADLRRASTAENGLLSHMRAMLFVDDVRAIVGAAPDLDESA